MAEKRRWLFAAAVLPLILAACVSRADRQGPGTGTTARRPAPVPRPEGAVQHVWMIKLENQAWIFLRVWFLYQRIEASFGLFSASANGDGVAFFAHVGGFMFGLLVTWLVARAGQSYPRS